MLQTCFLQKFESFKYMYIYMYIIIINGFSESILAHAQSKFHSKGIWYPNESEPPAIYPIWGPVSIRSLCESVGSEKSCIRFMLPLFMFESCCGETQHCSYHEMTKFTHECDVTESFKNNTKSILAQIFFRPASSTDKFNVKISYFVVCDLQLLFHISTAIFLSIRENNLLLFFFIRFKTMSPIVWQWIEFSYSQG